MKLLLLLPLLFLLIACGDPDARNEKGRTALIVAAEQGDLVQVEKLLKRDADIQLKDTRGDSALVHWP